MPFPCLCNGQKGSSILVFRTLFPCWWNSEGFLQQCVYRNKPEVRLHILEALGVQHVEFFIHHVSKVSVFTCTSVSARWECEVVKFGYCAISSFSSPCSSQFPLLFRAEFGSSQASWKTMHFICIPEDVGSLP